MKQLLIRGAMLCVGFSGLNIAHSQTGNTTTNIQKYWKLRNDFRENYVKIGAGPGFSIAARARRPIDCVDDIDINDIGTDGTPENLTPRGNPAYGSMHWGDGMIRHGYYLGLLATEYRLLKDAGEDVNGVLNELYFALATINRLDRTAEPLLEDNYQINFYEDRLNGYYLREDIPEDFAFQNWNNSPLEARCDHSPMYTHYFASKSDAHENSYQNVPSNDQLSSLMVGFSLIHSLVDDIYVRPPSQEVGFHIVTETKNIVNRIMTYLDDHNWMMIDVNGWPVTNGGGDASFLAYPFAKTAEKITGVTWDFEARRRVNSFNIKDIQYCLTGFGEEGATEQGQEDACDRIDLWDIMQKEAYYDLISTGTSPSIPGANNNQDNSVYQTWLENGNYNISSDYMEGLWETNDDFVQDLMDNGIISEGDYQGLQFLDPAKGSNGLIITNALIGSGLWSATNLSLLTIPTKNYQAELVNALIRGDAPYRQKGFYEGLLNSMPVTGPYNIITKYAQVESPPGSNEFLTFNFESTPVDGWGGEHKWAIPEGENGGASSITNGIYNGLDYMLFHNLYYLVFKSSLDPYKIQETCCNETVPLITTIPDNNVYGGVANYITNRERHNKKLQLINAKTVSALADVNNNVTGTFTIQPYFPHYVGDEIYTTKFQNMPATIQTGGVLNVSTRYQFCNGNSLTIKPGATLDIKKSKTSLSAGSIVTNEGTIWLRQNTTLYFPTNAKLILKPGSMLHLGAGTKLIIEEASLQYFDGATISLGATAQIIIRNSSIVSMNNGEFTIFNHDTQTGQIVFESDSYFIGETGKPGGKVRLIGKGKDMPYIILKPNAKVMIGNPLVGDNTIKQFVLGGCRVEMGTNTFIDDRMKSVVSNCSFVSFFNNKGISTQFNSHFTTCDFTNVPVEATMNAQNGGILKLESCTSVQNSPFLSAPTLVKVTGQGLSMLSCTVKGLNKGSVKTRSLTLASTITSSEIGYNNTVIPVGTNYIGMDDSSNVEFTLKKTNFTYNTTGVFKTYGKLTLRCNTFTANTAYNVNKLYGTVNANSTTGGGYNYFGTTVNNKNLYFQYPAIDFNNGYNFIATTSPSNQTVVVLSNTPHGMMQNQWNIAGTSPINVVSVTGSGSVLVTPTALNTRCPADGGGPIGTGGKGENTISDKSGENDNLPLVYSSILNDSIALDELYYTAANKMSAYADSLSDDVQALEYFKDMFAEGLNKSDSITAYWLWLGLSDMKKALENAFMFEHLQVEDNTVGYEDHVKDYAKALTYMTDPVITEENFLQQFNHEMNKAHLMHVICHTDVAVNILQELEYCGIDSLTQSQLNFWKSDYELSLAYLNAEVSPVDTALTVNTTDYIDPEYVVNGYSFGADISYLDHITYPNCNFFKSLGESEIAAESFMIFPNPAKESITIVADTKGAVMDCELRFEQVDGKAAILRKVKLSDKTKCYMQIDGFAPGSYIVTLLMPDGSKKVTKLVVQ